MLTISDSPSTIYLTLSKSFCAGSLGHSIEHNVSLRPYKDVVSYWSAGTRVSPIWPIDSSLSCQISLAKNSTVVLLGQVSPVLFLQVANAEKWIIRAKWISVGFFNMVVEVEDAKTHQEILHWAKGRKIIYEAWLQVEGKIKAAFYPDPFSEHEKNYGVLFDEDCRYYLHYISSPGHVFDGQLDASAHEYGALIASAVSTGERFWPDVSHDVLRINNAIHNLVRTSERQSEYIQTIVNINSSLSRLTSHAFSGVPPLFETEGHLWVHSLLGVGTACFAIREIVLFAYEHIVSHGFSDRLASLDSNPELFSDLILDSFAHADDAYFDTLAKTGWLDREKGDFYDDRVPFIAYLSSRDGFKYKELSISAPSSIVSACNSSRLSLRTLTHEISHAVIGSVLNSLLPTPDEIKNYYKDIMSQEAPYSWKLAMQRFLLMAMISMRQETHGLYSMPPEELQNTLNAHAQEVEEILVHIFDFFYFYQSDEIDYVKSIWISWEGIPKIDFKVEEYVLRTVCAVLSKYPYATPEKFDSARVSVLAGLSKIPSSPGVVSYSQRARDYINNQWNDIERKLAARMPFVRMATTFLLSNVLVERVNSSISLAHNNEWPSFLSNTEEGNPWLFLKMNSNDESCNEEKSAWMLNFLAYNSMRTP